MDRRDFMLGAAAIGGASALMGQAAVASPAVPAAAATVDQRVEGSCEIG